ncbi:MAG: adenylate kinase [Candidatus Bathyarchaeota archaeon]|nr:adenylate kinase [Candidatus Bathyarchaeota archaeon]MDH5636390.1 adenylate kinase [Candidatus Bathyarchaeota archaeon]
MGRVIVVTGIPGTGKTTVCNETLKLAEQTRKKIQAVNYGSIMVELSRKRGKNLHRDELRRSGPTFQRNLQAEAAKIISKKTGEVEGNLIVDTHMSIKTANGYLAGLPSHVLQLLNPEMFVLVEAEPHEVLSRRFKDKTRKRDKAMEDEIMEEILFSRLMAVACAVLTGASVKIVKNPAGKQAEAAEEILKLLV